MILSRVRILEDFEITGVVYLPPVALRNIHVNFHRDDFETQYIDRLTKQSDLCLIPLRPTCIRLVLLRPCDIFSRRDVMEVSLDLLQVGAQVMLIKVCRLLFVRLHDLIFS